MLILLLGSCVFAPLPNDAAKELARIQGKWIVWGSEQAGSYSELGQLSRRFVTIRNDLVIFESGKAERPSLTSRIAIVKPGIIDLLPNEKPLKGARLLGIYKVEGDKLTICHAMGESDDVKRPTQFKTAKDPNDPYILYVLKRVKE